MIGNGISIFSERNSNNMFIPKWTLIEHDQRYWFANQFLKNKKVVDCACGTGIGANVYAQSGAEKIDAFDISETAVLEAKKNNSSNSIVRISQSVANSLPLESSSIDVYISYETIEHIEDDNAYLKEALRVLKLGGTFICSTPNRVMTNPGCCADQKPINPYHVKEYSSREFFELISNYFVIVDTYGQNKKPSIFINFINSLKIFMPHPLPARIHQLFKVFWYFIGLSHKEGIHKVIDNADCYEFLIVVCKKKKF